MLSRKQFLLSSTASIAALKMVGCAGQNATDKIESYAQSIAHLKPEEVAGNEGFWDAVRKEFITSGNIINLNNGAVSPQPRQVREAHIANYNFCNEAPAYNMWHILGGKREAVRTSLASIAGCLPGEIAINRNTTEGLTTIISGLPLQPGDEVVLSKYDYPFMINAWKQREKRDNIKLVFLEPDLPIENDDYIVGLYKSALSPRTRIVHLTHILNWTGQIMPIRKIADMAHASGCEVVVDAAHSFALLDYSFAELGADYAAASLHKWLCAPFGTGLLYIKKEKIGNILPLLSSYPALNDDITKFETLGTRSFAAEAAVEEAIAFHQSIGARNKEMRLRFLKTYLLERISGLKKVKVYTSVNALYSCGMATFGVEGTDAGEIENYLFKKYNIHSSAVNVEKVNGIRISPHIYTTLQELDVLITGIKELAS
jgi:selenocysteine lyase/cysteine desulfurase